MGGGIIYVPVFFFFFGLPIKDAIGTSLLIIVFSSLSALLTHWRGKQVDFQLAWFVVLSGALGAQIGVFITSALPDLYVKVFFIALTALLSARMWLEDKSVSATDRMPYRLNAWVACLIGLVGGIVSGMGGIGGAIIIVPMMHFLMKVPMHICIGTTLVAVFFNSLSGSIGYLVKDMVGVRIAFIVSCAAVICAPLGARLSMKLAQKRLRRIFALVLIFASAAVLFKR